ncbi:hypothetical protein [Sporosarcina sp. Te-1]|uniref:hypothetical protein n=1 Tax=Sporosarcina sp. Te-1 TaxID=2818390 RepID=UPI001A9CFC28|nr:hypothetical protein [Sporosarcina sp. Te-1]QTD42771.1 hypothetical protein J3U78_08385 [Sporosarcina sp. Te-1]
MKISILKRHLEGVLWLVVIALFAVSLMTLANSYFNNKAINLLLTGCYDNGGEAILEIHNNVTSSYSFECKPK